MIYYLMPFLGLLLTVGIVYLLLKTVLNLRVKKVAYLKKEEPNTREANTTLSQPKEAKEEEPEALERFPVKIGDKVLFVELSEITYLEARDNFVYLHDLSGNEYLVDSTLKGIEERLPSSFLRVHRSHIVNKANVLEIHKYFNGKYAFMMRDTKRSKVLSSNSYAPQVKALFQV